MDKDEMFASLQEEEAGMILNEYQSMWLTEGDYVQKHQKKHPALPVECINIGFCY